MSPPQHLRILGGGLAGSTAALAALASGLDSVEIHEKSRLPRHKVCGEFLTPEIAPVLQRLNLWTCFQQAQPAIIRQLALHFGNRAPIFCALPAPAYGMSRYTLDALLLNRAVDAGASLINRPFAKQIEPGIDPTAATILAAGRQSAAPSTANRLFGFKAHFTGPADDTVHLFFFNNCYVGVSAVEHGVTNICGLGPEHVLRSHRFDFDKLLAASGPLNGRTRGLSRAMDWLTVAPLCFGARWSQHGNDEGNRVYPAGDALAFIDPFAGSGMTNAILMGHRAGTAAANGVPVATYLRECRRALARPLLMAGIFRLAIRSGVAEALAPLLPPRILFRATRPVDRI